MRGIVSPIQNRQMSSNVDWGTRSPLPSIEVRMSRPNSCGKTELRKAVIISGCRPQLRTNTWELTILVKFWVKFYVLVRTSEIIFEFSKYHFTPKLKKCRSLILFNYRNETFNKSQTDETIGIKVKWSESGRVSEFKEVTTLVLVIKVISWKVHSKLNSN